MASSVQSVPNPLARWLAHVLVGAAAAAAIGPYTGASGAMVAALIAVAVHHIVDAPVATALSGLGLREDRADPHGEGASQRLDGLVQVVAHVLLPRRAVTSGPPSA